MLPLLAVAAMVVLAKLISQSASDPNAALAVPAVLQPGATTSPCAALDARLPADLDGQQRRVLVVPDPGVAAWGDPAVVLRCGVTDPAELSCAAALTLINGVDWLSISGDHAVTYLAVDREVRIAVTLPTSVGIGVVQVLSNIIVATMPVRPVCVGGVLNPTTA